MPTPVGRRDDACYPPEPDSEAMCTADTHGTGHDDASIAELRAWPTERGAIAHADCDTAPDYSTLSISGSFYASAGVAVTVDRYDNTYGSVSGGVSTPGIGVSAMAGYLRDPAHPCDAPSEDKLESFLMGWSRTEIVGLVAASGGTTSSDMRSTELGLSSKQAGISVAQSWRVHDEEHPPVGQR